MADNEIMGTYEQEWDILYDDSGKRIEKVTYAPVNTLKGLIITKEDIEGFRNITALCSYHRRAAGLRDQVSGPRQSG